MNCRSAESLYSAFLEDELNQEEQRSLEAHLLGCRRCSAAVKELRQTLALVGALPSIETSPHFEDEIFDRIRSGEALRPTMIEWLGGFFTADRLRPVFLGGAAVCALWIAVIAMHPDSYFPRSGAVASRETGAPNANSPESGSLASSGGSSTAPGTESAPATPVFGPRSALASDEASPRIATNRRGKSGEDFQWVDSQVPVASAGSDSAVLDANGRFQDEYILDQFHLDRGDPGSQSIVPVSGNSSDDVYITF
jgi:anti-sigma factor RsiW